MTVADMLKHDTEPCQCLLIPDFVTWHGDHFEQPSPVPITPTELCSDSNPKHTGRLSDHLLWGTQVWKLHGVRRGHRRHGTTDVVLGLCCCSFRSWLGCFSHMPVCVLGDLSGWCEILTEEAKNDG